LQRAGYRKGGRWRWRLEAQQTFGIAWLYEHSQSEVTIRTSLASSAKEGAFDKRSVALVVFEPRFD